MHTQISTTKWVNDDLWFGFINTTTRHTCSKLHHLVTAPQTYYLFFFFFFLCPQTYLSFSLFSHPRLSISIEVHKYIHLQVRVESKLFVSYTIYKLLVVGSWLTRFYFFFFEVLLLLCDEASYYVLLLM